MNIVYVEYDMPGPSRMPFSAAPERMAICGSQILSSK